MAKPTRTVLPPNPRNNGPRDEHTSNVAGSAISDALMELDIERILEQTNPQASTAEDADASQADSEERSEGDDEDEDEDDGSDDPTYPYVPMVYPRSRYAGACNVETVKDGALVLSVVGRYADHNIVQ